MTVSPFASLRSRLFVVVSAAIAPFLLHAVLSATRDRTLADATLRGQSVLRARATAHGLDEQMRTVDRLLDTAMVWAHRSGPRRQLVDSTSPLLIAALSVAVIDTGGRPMVQLFGDSTRIEAIPRDRRTSLVAMAIGSARLASNDALSTFVDEGGTRIDSDSIAMIIVRPLLRPRNECNCLADKPGAVVAVLSDRAIQLMLGSDSLPAGAVTLLMGRAGLPIGRVQYPDRWIDRDIPDSSMLAAVVDREGVMPVTGLDGVARTAGFAALTRLPWRVYVGLTNANVSAAPDQRLRDSLMLFVLAFLIAGVGVVIASRALSAPLQTLVADTKRLAAGAFSHRTHVVSRGGEIGALGAAMNALASDLEARRKAMEEELRRAQQIFEEAPMPIWVTDASVNGVGSGRIRQANPAAARFFGVAHGALIGIRDSDLLDEDGAHLLTPAADAESTAPNIGRATLTTADGKPHECTLIVSRQSAAPHPIRIVTVLELVVEVPTQVTAAPEFFPTHVGDPEERHTLETFAGHVSSNFADLLHGIAGFSQLASDSGEDPDMVAIAIERIREFAQRGLAMAEQLQSFSASHAPHLQTLDVNDAVADVAREMSETFGRAVRLELRYNVSPAVVQADPALMHHLLSTLIATARDAMPVGGTLTVATTFIEVTDRPSEPFPTPPGRYIVLTVADTGMGVPADAQRRLFEPISSTGRERRAGEGLVLASVDGIAKEHGWSVGIDADPGVGTAISVYMPRAREQQIAEPAPDADQSSRDTAPARSA